jgi:hypothetical protein
VCLESSIPTSTQAQRGFRCLRVRGPLAFTASGILDSLTRPLAKANVSIFALSTFDTDYLMVPEHALAHAVRALSASGHTIYGWAAA